MGIKKQFKKITDNWLLVLLVIVLLLISPIFSSFSSMITRGGYDALEMAVAPAAERGYSKAVMYEQDFAPEVEERKITLTANLNTEVERGTFYEEQTKLKSIIKSSDSYLLTEDLNKYGKGRSSYLTGWYQIKVEATKYDAVIEQLKSIGKVQSFSENRQDVTGTYTDLNIEIEVEKERLKRYQEMYNEAKEISDKIELNDRIFNQERRIKYLEDSLKNIDRRIEYSTINFWMTEEQSGYANVVFVKFSELIKSLVNSFNSLLRILFVILPWVFAIVIIRFVWKLVKRK